MGRVFSLAGNTLLTGTGYVLAAMQPAAAGSAGSWLNIRRVEVSQGASTTSAQVYLALSARNTAGTLTVTSATPRNLVAAGPASGISGGTSPLSAATCGVNSSADSGGAYTDMWYSGPNALNGWLWVPTPSELIVVPPGQVFCVRFITAPGTTTGWNVTVVFEEIY
jgi:hypothetical protein